MVVVVLVISSIPYSDMEKSSRVFFFSKNQINATPNQKITKMSLRNHAEIATHSGYQCQRSGANGAVAIAQPSST
jgi:hypothetical protein